MTPTNPSPRNRSPVVDKAAQLLEALAGADEGLSLADLVDRLGLARSTVYRILNSLQAYGLAAKNGAGLAYTLGPRAFDLARLREPGADRAMLTEAAGPVMEGLSHRTREACKLSVRDGDELLSIRVTPSPAEYGLAVRAGHRAPLHAGGSSKAMLAHAPAGEIERVLRSPLKAYTPFTLTDPAMLSEVLDQIRRQGYAEDHAELTLGIRSVAAPIFGPSGRVVAALGIPFLGEPLPERTRFLRQAVVEGARTIELTVGGVPPSVPNGVHSPMTNSA